MLKLFACPDMSFIRLDSTYEASNTASCSYVIPPSPHKEIQSCLFLFTIVKSSLSSATSNQKIFT